MSMSKTRAEFNRVVVEEEAKTQNSDRQFNGKFVHYSQQGRNIVQLSNISSNSTMAKNLSLYSKEIEQSRPIAAEGSTSRI